MSDIQFGVENDFDFIAASFVRRAADVQAVREVLDRCRCEYTLSCRDRWFRFTCAVPTRKL